MGRHRAVACAVRATRLLVVLAALAVLAQGVADVLPGGLPQAPVAAATSSAPPADTSMQAPDEGVLVRAPALAAVPAPVGAGAAALPADRPLLAAHLVVQPHARPPTAVPAATAPGAPGSRAPPSPAGT